MTERQEIYFELFDAGDLVRLEPIDWIKYNSNLDWDKNWVKTKLTIKGGHFNGQYSGDFRTTDFELLKQALSQLYNNLKGTANFKNIEGNLELNITGDGIGHFEVDVKARDTIGVYASELTFTMSFDQTEIKELVNQLDRITNQFPITGDSNIKHE